MMTSQRVLEYGLAIAVFVFLILGYFFINIRPGVKRLLGSTYLPKGTEPWPTWVRFVLGETDSRRIARYSFLGSLVSCVVFLGVSPLLPHALIFSAASGIAAFFMFFGIRWVDRNGRWSDW